MRILILDDDMKRQEAFWLYYRNLYGDKITGYRRAHTADEAIAYLLSNDPFDVVQLDHDLGGQQMIEIGPGTGEEVARAFAEAWGAKQHGRVIVHSYNGKGALNMLAHFVLKGISCEYRAFGVWDR